MKVLVVAYDLVLSGVTVNAIELAAALRDQHGHDVVFFAGAGPLRSLVDREQLRYVEAPASHGRVHPSFCRVKALGELVRQERPDVIHAWDWHQALDAYAVQHLVRDTPLLVTDMCMVLQKVLPRTVLTTFGVPAIRDEACRRGHIAAEVLLPPVDTDKNRPGAVDATAFRKRHWLGDDELVLVLVSRLDRDMKAESILRLLKAIGALGRVLPLKAVIVGDGNARGEIEQAAATVNTSLGRQAVILVPLALDPREAYAAADVVVGMGGSALRGLAFAKPVVVVGQNGFARPFMPSTSDAFFQYGFYGDGASSSALRDLEGAIRWLASDASLRTNLGGYGAQFVAEHYSLPKLARQLSDLLVRATTFRAPATARVSEAARTAVVWTKERRFLPLGTTLRDVFRQARRVKADVPARTAP